MTTDSKPTGWRPERRSLIAGVRYQGLADEGYYRGYAERLAQAGVTEFRVLFDEFLADEAIQVFPHPLHIGYLGAPHLRL